MRRYRARSTAGKYIYRATNRYFRFIGVAKFARNLGRARFECRDVQSDQRSFPTFNARATVRADFAR